MISGTGLTLIAILLMIYWIYTLTKKAAKLQLTFIHTKKNESILKLAPALSKAVYTPTPYLANGHLQTIYYALYHLYTPAKETYPHERVIVPLSDGGEISIDYIFSNNTRKSLSAQTPIVVILPGLTGDRCDEYIQSIINEVISRDFLCVVINHRGCSGTPLTSPKLYCAGSIDDTEAGIKAIRSKYALNPLFGVGVSLGACILCNYSASKGKDCPFRAIVSVCAPYEMFMCSKMMDTTLFGLYHRGLGFSAVKKIK
eukprot:TRINITY_DN4222_c0_g1_i1.p1 TRINITY_DN4222_c0_g1~~TRINITY_DN4222_c0_g1_i1.p1  ORF type:complete len:257 (-),score=17.80 TRINITY_DN4222_c0_g1_i1:397-1167(-)